ELHCFVGQQIGEIPDAIERRQVLPQVGRASWCRVTPWRIRRTVREVIDGAAQHTEELVEAMIVRAEFRPPPEMPLPNQRRLVAVGLQERGDSGMSRRQTEIARR